MFGPSGKLYQPPHVRRRIAERKQRELDDPQRLAEAMARVNAEKRLPEKRDDAHAV